MWHPHGKYYMCQHMLVGCSSRTRAFKPQVFNRTRVLKTQDAIFPDCFGNMSINEILSNLGQMEKKKFLYIILISQITLSFLRFFLPFNTILGTISLVSRFLKLFRKLASRV